MIMFLVILPVTSLELITIKLPNLLLYNHTFSHCYNLQSFTIIGHLSGTGTRCFVYCYSLKEINIIPSKDDSSKTGSKLLSLDIKKNREEKKIIKTHYSSVIKQRDLDLGFSRKKVLDQD